MKKIIKSTVVVFGVTLLLLSCKKDYNCSCKGEGNGTENGTENTYYKVDNSYEYLKEKEEDAKSSCTGNESTLSNENGGITVKCSLSKK